SPNLAAMKPLLHMMTNRIGMAATQRLEGVSAGTATEGATDFMLWFYGCCCKFSIFECITGMALYLSRAWLASRLCPINANFSCALQQKMLDIVSQSLKM